MDLVPRRYETFADSTYCIRVASAVGLMCVEIFGYRDPGARQYAIDLGVALQLTNILRDVPRRSASAAALYIPLEDLRALRLHGQAIWARGGDAGHGVRSAAVKELLASRRSARASTTAAPTRRCRARTRAGWSPPRSWARSTAASSTGSSAATTTSSPRHPRPAAATRPDRRDDVGADGDHAAGRTIDGAARRMTSRDVVDVVVIGAGFAGLAAATALAEAAPAVLVRTRGRSSAAARRRSRSRDRRARRQRPARAVRLLPRDVRRCSAHRRRGQRPIVRPASRCRISIDAGRRSELRCPSCRRRCTCWAR